MGLRTFLPASSIRGALLEETVLYLLTRVGYRIIEPGEEATRAGTAGMEVRGRGDWHQLDSLAAFDHTPAFMYPLRLLVEAKCYARGRPVGIEVVRNALGVLIDISQNYFTMDSAAEEIQVSRFNYHAAVFSTSGYTAGAQRYAIAHQVFLIRYEDVPLMAPVADGLLGFEPHEIEQAWPRGKTLSDIRREFRSLLDSENDTRPGTPAVEYLRTRVVSPLRTIEGSYFGMLQGRYPMHLLATHELPQELFATSDEVLCTVRRDEFGAWAFRPSQPFRHGDFELQFNLPPEIARLAIQISDPFRLADMKRRRFSFIDLSGLIGGVRRTVRLTLDEDWLKRFLSQQPHRR